MQGTVTVLIDAKGSEESGMAHANGGGREPVILLGCPDVSALELVRIRFPDA